MKKLSLTLNLNNIDKTKINTRTYTDKNGVEVTVKEYKVDLVITDQATILKETDTYTLKKVGFICDPTTKAERDAGKKTNYVGEAMQFVNKETQEKGYSQDYSKPQLEDEIDLDMIPF